MDCKSVLIDVETTPLADPPIYLGSLRPIVPPYTGRYEVATKVKRSHVKVAPGNSTTTSSTSLPQYWSSSVHPEGKIYFYRVYESGLHIVTDSYLFNSEIGEKICAWTEETVRQAKAKDIVLSDNVELFLQLSDDDCNYYFTDRTSRKLFWIEECETYELGLHPVVSLSHLDLVLEAQYWSHIENFCMHFGGLPQKSIDDLILVFSHGLADTLTSSLSTFPYDAPACEKYLNLLTASRGNIHEGYIVTLVARLWGVILYNRYETHYGQEQARLSRDASIIDADESEEVQWSRTALSLVTLKVIEPYQKSLDSLFIDQLVYGSDWDAFMSSCIRGWQHSIVASFGLLLMHVFCFFLPLSPILATFSGLSSSLSILSAILLIHRHEELDKAGASPAHDYLDAVRSPRFKFQGVALVYSLPKTLFLWAIIAFFSQWAVLLSQYAVYPHVAFCVVILLACCGAFQYATSRTQFTRPSFLKFGKKEEASMV